MKNPLMNLAITTFFVIACFSKAGAQKISREDYFGKWRWCNNKNDTLIILLKPAGHYKNLFMEERSVNGIIANVVGFHQYIDNGKESESSMAFTIEDTIRADPGLTITGRFVDKDQRMTLSIFNIKKNVSLGGYLQILPINGVLNDKKLAAFEIGDYMREGWPVRFTLPNMIILEKIE